MLRPASVDDLPLLTQWMLDLRDHTCWSAYQHEGYDAQSVLRFLQERLLDTQSMCVLWESGGHPTAFCGGSLSRFYLPPYMSTVHEWGWSGSPRYAIQCWRAITVWAKGRGAELAYRSTGRPGSNHRRLKEEVTWEVL